jgi:hypothetical protein
MQQPQPKRSREEGDAPDIEVHSGVEVRMLAFAFH